MILTGMNTTNEPEDVGNAPSHAEVASTAYAIYARHGSHDGEDLRDWLEAERRLTSQRAPTVHGRPSSVLGSNHATR